MRILQVNKFLYRRAGAETYFLDLAQLLVEKGHKVGMWGTDHNPISPPRTPPPRGGEIDEQFPPLLKGRLGGVSKVELLVCHLNFDRREGILRDLKKFGHMLWSREAARKFEGVLKEFKPEIVHLHNIYHHISPSILPVAARFRVPVTMTVHDWHLINPNYALFDHGEICERNGLRAIAHRCIKNSYAASFADVLEWRLHKLMRVYERYVAKFIVPNEFVKGKLVAHGMDGAKIEVVPLPVTPTPPRPPSGRGGKIVSPPLGGGVRGGAREYVLFSGRLTVEKGIYLLLEIAKQLPDIQFKIAGTGPEESGVRCQVSGVRNVELLGFQEKVALGKIIAGARLVIVPSLWYDLSPLSVLEAMAAGKVVVASKIGGIPELIEEGKTGVLVGLRNYEMAAKSTKAHNSPQPPLNLRGGVGVWVDKLRKLYYDEKILKRVGEAAAEYVAREHNPEKHYAALLRIYREVMRNS